MKDLEKGYKAPSKQTAATQLDELARKWGKKYPSVIKSWRANWSALSQYFKYPDRIRRIMYTTNIIEGYHRNVRKRTKTKGAFSNDKTLIKHLYLVQEEMTSKWGKIKNWGPTLQQLEVTFPEALKNSATHGSYPPCVAVTQFFEHYLPYPLWEIVYPYGSGILQSGLTFLQIG